MENTPAETPGNFKPVSPKLIEAYNSARSSKNKDVFCHAPFRSLYFSFHGDAHPCCENLSYTFGKYPEKSVHEIWFGENMQKFRNHILHNDLSLGCALCKHYLEIQNYNGVKARFYDNAPPAREYPTRIELVATTGGGIPKGRRSQSPLSS